MDENIIFLKGHISNDPKVTTNGNLSVRFTVACNRKTSGDTQPSADFVPCVAFAKSAEIIEKLIAEGKFKKGTHVYIRGYFRTGSYTSQNTNQVIYTYECLVGNVDVIGNKQPSSEVSTPAPGNNNGFGQQSGFASQSVPVTPPVNPQPQPQPSIDDFAAMSSGLPWS